MNLDEIDKKCFILALFIRDDGQRFLLGSGAYEFKDSQLHFAANTMSNDVVEVQGNDGYLLAGQVRRPTTQVFDGYIGDASINKSDIEGYRRDFFAFFQKNHFYTVVYIFPDGTAIQRRRGFIVDAGEIRELYQMFPEYHIGLNFEDVNYYKYAEDEDGHEQYAKSIDINISKAVSGGLIWDEVSQTQAYNHGTDFSISGTIEDEPVDYIDLYGDTEQTTYSGKNLLNLVPVSSTSNGITTTLNADGSLTCSGTASDNWANVTTTTVLPQTLSTSDVIVFSIQSSIPAQLYARTLVSSPYQRKDYIINVGNTSSGSSAIGMAADSVYLFLNNLTVGVTYNFTIKQAQLEKSSTPTQFEPYVGGTASPNPDYPQEVQTVTGEQSVNIRSKNILDKTTLEQGTFNYLTGADSEDSNRLRTQKIACIPNTTYTASANRSLSECAVVYYAQDGTTIIPGDGAATGNSYYKFTTPAGAYYMRARFGSQWNAMTLGNEYNLQIEMGSSVTAYEQYYGDVTKTVNLGKNLCNPAEVTSIFLYNLANKAAYLSGNTSVVIPVEQNNSYTVSTTETQSRCRVAVCDSIPVQGGGDVTCYSGSNIDNTSNSVTINSGTHKYLIVNATDLTKIQIEKGSVATTYAPYFTPIELCKIGTYQDYIYSVNGDYYLHKEVVKISPDGTETWNSLSISNPDYIYCYTSAFDSIVKPKVWDGLLSDKFAVYDYSGGGYEWISPSASIKGACFSNGDNSETINLRVICPKTTANSVGNFKTWLGNSRPVFYYPIKTPTDTQITNATLIAQLEALNSATTYAGVTWFKTESEYLPADTWAYVQIQAGGGVVWDNYGATWEEGGGGMIVNVNVDSIENVYPVWTVNGPTDTPILTNLTTGTSITYNGNITASQTLVVDMLNQTALLNGTSVIGKLSGDWIELAPGMNRMSYTATNEQTAPKSTLEWQEIVG